MATKSCAIVFVAVYVMTCTMLVATMPSSYVQKPSSHVQEQSPYVQEQSPSSLLQQHYGSGEQHDDDTAAAVQPEEQPEQPDAVQRSYHFQYAVHDATTGDVKSQNEVSDGRGTVKGTYSVVEADGSTRVVEYTANDEHGFNAEVKKIEPQHRQGTEDAGAEQSEYGGRAYDYYPERNGVNNKAPFRSPAPVHSDDDAPAEQQRYVLPELFMPAH